MPKNFLLVMASVVLFGLSAGAQSCPVPAGDDTLTLSGIMRNFGRGLLPADKAVQRGMMDAPDVTDAQLAEAIAGIRMVETCAQMAHDDQSGALWPTHSKELSGNELKDYLETFRFYMAAFVQSLGAYSAEFEAQAGLPAAQRAYDKLDQLRQDVRARASDAHKNL